MKIRTPDTAATDLIPLVERFRYMRVFRLSASALVVLAWLALPQLPNAQLGEVALVTTAYVLVTLAGDVVRRISDRRALPLFGALLIADGLYFAWVAYVLAPPTVAMQFLVLVHLIAVSLMASFRTGLKLAMWHSLLLLGVFHGREAGLVPEAASGGALGDAEYRVLIWSIAVYSIVAVVTATFAAVNERELRRRRYDLEALAHLALRLERATEAASAARALTETVADELGFERVLVFDLRHQPAQLLDHHGIAVPPTAAPAGDTLVERLAAEHRTRLVSCVSPADDPWLAALLPDHRNLIMIPLIAEDRAVAMLVCEHRLRHGSRVEQRVVTTLERFASHAALAMNNAWLVEQLEDLAATDALTGVSNRRTFDASLVRELARASRGGDRAGVVMVDIDRFKLLNDTHGHAVGDRVLQHVAQVLDVNVRAIDTVARLGGEEFGLILPGLDSHGAATVSDRLRALIEGADTDVPVTASFGVAVYPDDAGDPATLMELADRALYESKASGRNRVTSAAAAAD